MSVGLEKWAGKIAIVTGASSGIGLAISEKLVEEGLLVVGLARRLELLESLAKKLSNLKGKFLYFQCDLTKEEDILHTLQQIKDTVGPIHILVNNAGILFETDLCHGETKFWRESFELNVISRCILVREVIKNMNENNVDGQIIHMNSVLGHTVYNIPKLNVYPATQFAITAMTETLRQELLNEGSKIKITSLSPGAVQTEMLDKAEAAKSKIEHVLQPRDVADAVCYILSTPPHVQMDGCYAHNRLAVTENTSRTPSMGT